MSELKARHRHTTLGMLWALVQPITMMLVLTLVFSVFVRVPADGHPYPLFAYIGLVSWIFFANSLSAGITSVVSNMNLVTKASFPREVIPLAKLVSNSFDFLISWGCLVLLLLAYGFSIGVAWLALPGVLVIHFLFTAGIVLWGSALYVLKRDVGSVLPLILQIGMYLSPVVYPVGLIPDQYRILYLLNPMAAIIQSYRDIVLAGVVPTAGTIMPALAIACAVFLSGYFYFKSVEHRFADIM